MNDTTIMHSSLASYLPDSQLITLNPEIPAFTDPHNIRGFRGVHEIAYFFHEWTHYLHNVSTGHGLCSFANLVHLWHEFRKTIGSDGLSVGSHKFAASDLERIIEKLFFFEATRKPSAQTLPGRTPLNSIRVVAKEKHEKSLPASNISQCTIKMQLVITNTEGDEAPYHAELGPHEIIESVAFMLEERFTQSLNEEPEDAPVAPYHLLKILASHIDPSLDNESILLCGLASLQDTVPSWQIVDLLQAASNLLKQGKSIRQVLSEKMKNHLTEQNQWIEDCLKTIESSFPLDEPMALAIRNTTQLIRSNFKHRLSDPFFELSIIEELASQKDTFENMMKCLMEKYGICALVQRNFGLDDTLQRDHLYDFAVKTDTDDLRVGRRIMQASFHFMRQHFSTSGFIATDKLPTKSSLRCPFYTSCELELRQTSGHVCACTPWRASTLDNSDICWYEQGVRKIGPPKINSIDKNAALPGNAQ